MESSYVLTGRGADSSASLPVPWRSEVIASLPALQKGTWFDEAVDFRDPEGEVLTREILALTAAVETRTRRRRPADERNHRAALRAILANGLRCHYFRRPALVAYSRKADGYSDGPGWLSGEAMARTVDLLVKAKLIEGSPGQWGRASSTYSVTGKLCGLAQACGITDHSLTVCLPPRRLVRLREAGSCAGQMVFQPTVETIRWMGRLRAYNAFLAQQDIGLTLTAEEEAEWVRSWNAKRKRKRRWEQEARHGCGLYRPELIQTDLYRQFNNGSFRQGGRLYGGWWINTPKVLRPKITINGQPTVELDFSGCAIRMLYHVRGIDYQGDPYRLEDIAAHETKAGLPPGHFRDAIKAMTQALINDQHGTKPEMIDLDGLSFRPRFKRRDVRRMIEDKHNRIKDAFGTGAGLFLQSEESDLALNIIIKLMESNIVALPIHDSFLVDRSKKFITKVWMNNEYYKRFGFYPKINSLI